MTRSLPPRACMPSGMQDKARRANKARKADILRTQRADTWLSSAPPAVGKRKFGGVGVGKADERDGSGFINFAGAMKVSKTVANKEGMHRAGQLLIPKFDNPGTTCPSLPPAPCPPFLQQL